MQNKAFQDFYSKKMAQCYGCGFLNEHGNKLKSYWDGENTIAHFKPEHFHTAIEGIVYGGLIASIIDCHGTGSAAAFHWRENNKEMTDNDPEMRFVTANLNVDYLKPTPIDATLELRGKLIEIKNKKVVVEVDVIANSEITARGRVIAIQVPENLI